MNSIAMGQTDIDLVELDLRSNPAGDSLQVYVRVTGPTDFSGSLNEIKYTIRWEASGPSDINIDPNGLTQFCPAGYDIMYYQQVAQYPTTGPGAGFAYATMISFGLPPISQVCPDQVWAMGQWRLIQRISIVNIGAGCTEFQIVNDAFTATTGRETFVELMGEAIDHIVDPIPAYIGVGGGAGACAPDCNDTPGGQSLPGTPCDDPGPGSNYGVWDANCACIPVLPPYAVTVSGHIIPCNQDIASGYVVVSSAQGTQPMLFDTIPLNSNCYYTTTLMMDDPTGWFQVEGNCMDGTMDIASGQYVIDPVTGTATLVLDMDCGAPLLDCANVLNGGAYLDDCGNCVGGTTGLDPCIQDCDDVWGGAALPGTPCQLGPGLLGVWDPDCECIPSSGDCSYILNLFDSGGDGWNGSYVTVCLNGICDDHTLLNAFGSVSIPAYSGQTLAMSYTAVGGDQEQISFDLQLNGVLVYASIAPPATGLVYSSVVDCGTSPTCNADFTMQQSIVNGTSVPYSLDLINLSTGVGDLTYLWTLPAGPWQTITLDEAEPTGYILPDSTEGTAYMVELTITDDAGCTSTLADSIFVSPAGELFFSYADITCSVSFDVVQGGGAFQADFINTSSTFISGTYFWLITETDAFGNVIGSFPNEPGDLSFEFDVPGIYHVCLQSIIFGYGCSGLEACQTVFVDANGTISSTPIPGDCQAGFWVIQAYENNPAGEVVPIPYNLWIWNLSTGNSPFQFVWDFGDGNTSTEAYPTHIYGSSGPYLLCLSIEDGSGCTDTYCDSISVNNDGLLGMMLHGTVRNALTINVVQNMPTSIEESTIQEMRVWPNPTSDLLNISIGSAFTGSTSVAIFDINGRIVRTMDRTFNRATNMITLPVGDLSDGIYTIRIDNGGRTITHRFVKNQ